MREHAWPGTWAVMFVCLLGMVSTTSKGETVYVDANAVVDANGAEACNYRKDNRVVDSLAGAGGSLPGESVHQTTYYAAPEFAEPPAVRGSDTNDGLTVSAPFVIENFWRVARAGDTLVLLDGRYTGPRSMICAGYSVSVNGTADSPITIRALNDGRVTIDGELLYQPVFISGAEGNFKSYFVIQGINACNSSGAVIWLGCCKDCTVRRVCAWNANPYKNNHVYRLYRTFRCLVEDCASWGLGRKQVSIYGGGPGQVNYGADNILRRFWCRWEGTRYQGNHSENISFQYRAQGSLLENVVCTHDARESIDYPLRWDFSSYFYSDAAMDFIRNTRLFGCVGYALNSNYVRTRHIFRVGGPDVVDTTLRDCLTYVEPGRETGEPDYEIQGFNLCGRFYDSIKGQHLTVVGGRGMRVGAYRRSVEPNGPVIQNVLAMNTLDPGDRYQAALLGHKYVDTVHFFNNAEHFESNHSCTGVPTNILSPAGCERDCGASPVIDDTCRTAPGTDPQLNIAGRSLLRPYTSPALRLAAPDGTDVGARIWFRYVDGVLKDGETDGQVEYLWPWPMEERIWRGTLEYHLLNPDEHPGPVNVTQEVLQLGGGALPGDFNGDGDIDAADGTAFGLCCTGPNVPVTDPDCYAFDFDEDGDIDDEDRAVFDNWLGYERPDFEFYRLLRIASTPPGVPVLASPVGVNNMGDGVTTFIRVHAPGTVVTLTGPLAVGRYVFDHWEIDNRALPEGQRSVTVVLDDDRTAKALYIEDCNHNGVADSLDIADGASRDSNANGIPDECEMCGDLDGDEDVDLLDFAVFASFWLEADCGTCAGCDLAGDDGRVALDDLREFVADWLVAP
ncbi:MAG: hypothetical protein JSU70_15915 [Phycisphaerales bacterium]|nr:MAG: hypothetical protein JSU70_15915 [Phycisphaerales bacterium]